MNVPLRDWTVETYNKFESECESALDQLADWSTIPTINDFKTLDNFKDGYIARYFGMVQDILNPEYYPASFKVKNAQSGHIEFKAGRFIDVLHCQDSEELSVDGEGECVQEIRQPLFCVPIPGLNDWVKNTPYKTQTQYSGASFSGQKRPANEDNDMDVDFERKTQLRTSTDTRKQTLGSYSSEQFFPVPGERGLACIVKHHGDKDSYLVNTRIEVIGFLGLNPALEATWDDCDAEDKALHPPPSLVPRLHALRIRKLSHSNLTLPMLPEISEDDAKIVRSDIHTVLTQLLFGDTLAAEYLICNLLATVYARRDGLCLGSLSLNLHNIVVPHYAKKLFEFLQLLIPCSVYLPLTIEILNTTAFIPKKDYETNRLTSGRLQLPDDTQLYLDETVMAAGQLTEQGLRNLGALQTISMKQEIRYDFTYFQLDFMTNVSTIIASEGKSIIPNVNELKRAMVNLITTSSHGKAAVTLPLVYESGTESTTSETFDAARFFMSGPRLKAVRNFLSTIRLRECDLSNTDFVGEAWVQLRQQYQTLKEDDLHRLLVLSRLITLGDGRTAVVQEDWDKAVAMEKARWSRIAMS